MKSRFILLMVAILFLATVTPVTALEVETDMQTGMLWSEAGLVTVISEYFSSRQSFLNNQRTSILHAVAPILSDEIQHQEALAQNGIVINSTVCHPTEILIYENTAFAVVEETVSYEHSGNTDSIIIEHQLSFTRGSNGEIIVDSDAYFDALAEFASCSFVPDTQFEINVYQTGGRNCLTNIAINEEGYQEGSNNYTKYGVWYGAPNAEWCVIFVSWCANQASIPTSVIPVAAGTGDMRRFFGIDTDDFDYTPQYQGTAEPAIGDIFMFGTSRDDPVSHVGIVVGVNGDYIQIVHGNYPSSVLVQTIPKSDSRLLAYGKPSYGGNHASNSDWEGDIHKHWHECEICGDQFDMASHSYVYQSSSKKYVCTVCGYTSDYAPGIVMDIMGGELQ